MKRLFSVAIVVASLLAPRAVHAQNYSIGWYAIGGGGGTSVGTNSGTVFSVTGTIGQVATTTMSGGSYSVTSGFWSILAAIQTPGSPLLSITPSGGQAVISWSASASGFTLQQSSTLGKNSWSAFTAPLTTNGGTISVTVPVTGTGGYQYFRLVNP